MRAVHFDESALLTARERTRDLGVAWLPPDGFDGPGVVGRGIAHPYSFPGLSQPEPLDGRQGRGDADAAVPERTFVVDHFASADRLARVAAPGGRAAAVRIAVDLGGGSVGVEIGPELDRLLAVIRAEPFLRPVGLTGEFPPWNDDVALRKAVARVEEAARRFGDGVTFRVLLPPKGLTDAAGEQAVRAAVQGLAPVTVTDGGDWLSPHAPRPFVSFDAAVISRPRRDRAVLDFGRATVAGLETFRVVPPGGDEASGRRTAGEFTSAVAATGPFADLTIGDRVTIVPDRPWIVLAYADRGSVVIRRSE